MKKVSACGKKLRIVLSKIHIVDKFIIIFMMLLLFQSTYNLFMDHTDVGEAKNIDIIVRTSTAAIFGYFLSTNFIRHENKGVSKDLSVKGEVIPPSSSGGIQNHRIGFDTSDSQNTSHSLDIGSADVNVNEDTSLDQSSSSQLQIIVASMVGLFCLIVLILLRNISVLSADMISTASATATVTQFRDIVSGCIGFLIGCPTTGGNAQK